MLREPNKKFISGLRRILLITCETQYQWEVRTKPPSFAQPAGSFTDIVLLTVVKFGSRIAESAACSHGFILCQLDPWILAYGRMFSQYVLIIFEIRTISELTFKTLKQAGIIQDFACLQ